jgi:hypothetical protein
VIIYKMTREEFGVAEGSHKQFHEPALPRSRRF